MLKKSRKPVTKSTEVDPDISHLPVLPPKADQLFKAVLDQKFHEFGVALREEFDRQVMAANADLRDSLFRERNERKRANRLIFGLFAVILLLTSANIYFVLNTTEKSVTTALSAEMGIFERKTKETTTSLFIPMQRSVEKNLSQVTSELSLSRGYIDIFSLEALARNGSRRAYEELLKIGSTGGPKGIFAAGKVKEVRSFYDILAEPKRQNLTLGELVVTKGGAPTTADSLSAIELIYVLNSPGATMPQIHQILTMLWNQNLNKNHENEMWNILQNSQNLPAAVATCSLLQKNFGNRYSMYDFAKWKAFLENRM